MLKIIIPQKTLYSRARINYTIVLIDVFYLNLNNKGLRNNNA